MNEATADVFDTFDAKDGYHVVKIEQETLLGIHCFAYSHGERFLVLSKLTPDDPVVSADGGGVIRFWKNPTDADRGACERLHMALDAIARYLSTGGSWDDLTRAVSFIRNYCQFDGLVFPGWYLSETYLNTDSHYQHVFVKEGTRLAVVWEEPEQNESGGLFGGFIERTDVDAINKSREDDELSEGRGLDTGEESPPGLPQLQHRQGPESP